MSFQKKWYSYNFVKNVKKYMSNLFGDCFGQIFCRLCLPSASWSFGCSAQVKTQGSEEGSRNNFWETYISEEHWSYVNF